MGFLVKAVKSVVKAVVGVVSKVAGGIFGFAVGGKSKKGKTVNSLNKSLEPEAYRKIIFGKTAAPLDVRFWQVWGTNGTKFDEVLALASHRVNAVKELYFENTLAIDAGGTVQAPYIGVVTRATVLGTVGQTALAVGDGAQYTAGATFDGCAAMVLAWEPDEKKLPNGIPSRYTQVVEGALVYDPRRDSTQIGGSGSHRANDRSTWSYATVDGNGQPIGRNNALQALWYLLGWTIPTKDAGGTVTGEVVVCGRGIDPSDINMATFIAGANACEVAGYYTDIVLTTEDDHTTNEGKITCGGLIGRLLDPGGLWSYYANVDDTANIAVELTDADILDGVSLSWDEYKGMSEQYNQVVGKFVNPSASTLFQAFPYPMVRDAAYEANLGVKRRKSQDFEQVLDGVLAQRLARLMLNEAQYQGELQAGFMARAIKAQAWSVVRYTSERFGWTKLFRVWRHDISTEGGVTMLLKEIHASIWGAGTVAGVAAPGVGQQYNARQEIALSGLAVALFPTVAPDGTNGDGFKASWSAPPINVRRTELRYKLVGSAFWNTAGPVERDVTSIVVAPLFSGAQYQIEARHISVNEIPGPWVAFANTYMGTTGNVNYAAIAAAGGTAVWSSITGAGKPTDFADVTSANVASGIAGQGALATLSIAGFSNLPSWDGSNLIADVEFVSNLWGVIANGGALPTFVSSIDAQVAAMPAKRAVRFTSSGAAALGAPRADHTGLPINVNVSYRMGAGIRVSTGFNGQVLLGFFIYNPDGSFAGGFSTSVLDYRTVPAAGFLNFVRYGDPYKPTTGAIIVPYINVIWGASPPAGDCFVAYPRVWRVDALGLNILREDGTTLLTDALAVTSLGVASAITGQAATATSSDFGVITGGTKPSDNAGTTNKLIYAITGGGAGTSKGNTLYKSAATGAWDTAWFTAEATKGNGHISATSTYGAVNAALTFAKVGVRATPFSGIGIQLSSSGIIYWKFDGTITDTGYTYVGGDNISVQFDGVNLLLFKNGAFANSNNGFDSSYVNSDLVGQFSIYGQGAELKDCNFTPSGSNAWNLTGGTGKPEDSADVTSYIDGIAEVIINADSSGAVLAGQVPKATAYKFIRSNADLTTSAAWSVTVLSGTISASIGAATGVLSINTSGGVLTTGKVKITATYNGVARTKEIIITKNSAVASTGGGSGGGTGGTGQNATITGTQTSTTPVVIISPTSMTVNAGSLGQVTLTADYTYTSSGTSPKDMTTRWQRNIASVWTDVGSARVSDSQAYDEVGGGNVEGYGSHSETITGLGANTTGLQFRLTGYNSGLATTTARYPSGTAAANGG